jgi:signal transduction histidine kinase/ActR/RegA family two-component response regulator
MIDSLRRLWSDNDFMPHGMCYLWRPDLLTLHVISDALIALAYFSIPFTLVYFVRKRKDLSFPRMFFCFAVFIIACGTTHLMEIWVIWHPAYWLSGGVKALTALASVPTAILLVRLVPRALQLPSPADLRVANAELEREIAERKRGESDIRKMNEQLEARVAERTAELEEANRALRQTQITVMQNERLRALGQMASGIAHDINNALSPATLYSRLLLESEVNLSPQAREYLTDVHRAIEDIAHTVARMRDFYRARDPQFTPVRIDINPILEEAVEMTRARWHHMPQEQGIVIELQMELAAELTPVLGVESEIRDALVNLILNAVDAMPEGGVLTLRTREVADLESGEASDSGLHGKQPPGVRVCVDVCDTGVGMSEETRRKCLEPFFTTKGERGTGLGLAMAYGMVQRHGANIVVDSELRKGARMSLEFSAARVAREKVPADAHETSVQPVPRVRILVVDDEPRVLKSLKRVLEIDGHRVSVADGGQAGIDSFLAAERRGEPFALVITDLGMPYLDGRKLAAAVKAASPLTPVVLFTGWGHRMRTENDLPPHVDRLLSKPPDVEELRRTIAALAVSSSPGGPSDFLLESPYSS